MKRVIRAFQVEFKNARKRTARQSDKGLLLYAGVSGTARPRIEAGTKNVRSVILLPSSHLEQMNK